MSIHRIIPTRMGTRVTDVSTDFFHKDHPHAYGDKMFIKNMTEISLGSSPRVWGQVCHTDIIYLRNRIIPTRMGTSFSIGFILEHPKDHPHAYGDKSRSVNMRVLPLGSSPRVWGQVARGEHQQVRYGIIPTRMGTRR